MKAKSFKCESCGAVLPQSEDKKVVCSYCGTTAIYEKEETNKQKTKSKNTEFNLPLAIILFLINPIFGLIYIAYIYSKNPNAIFKSGEQNKDNKKEDDDFDIWK